MKINNNEIFRDVFFLIIKSFVFVFVRKTIVVGTSTHNCKPGVIKKDIPIMVVATAIMTMIEIL